jgi:RND family efflux transporter MFP subunit
MMLLLRILLPVLVLAAAGAIAVVTLASRPEPQRRAPRVALTQVEVISLARSDYKVWIETRGTVRPRTESTLIPEVSGRIMALSPSLRTGEFFEEGNLLLQIDPRDYQTAVTVAEAALAQARAALAEELARANQAQRDWRRLGEKGKPDELVLRKPQLAGARASVRSAEAQLARAQLDLERTTLRAPYAGRVLEQNVDVGQYVSTGTPLAKVYAVDFAEVRLPLSNRQLEFVDVPEIYRRDTPGTRPPGPALQLIARVGGATHTWQGQVVRAEGAIDTKSRQLFVVGQIEDPYGKAQADRPPLKVGQFVEARIEGHVLRDVFVVPRSALRLGTQVQIVDDEDRVRNLTVTIRYSDEARAVIDGGLSEGTRLVVTPVGAGMEGVRVEPLAAGSPGEQPGGGRKRQRDTSS